MNNISVIFERHRAGRWFLFSLLAFASVVLIFSMVRYLPEIIAESVIETDVRKQAVVWKRRVVSHLNSFGDTFADGEMLPEEVAFLKALPEASEVYRLKLFDKNGTVFWSSHAEDVSSTSEASRFLDTVIRGEIRYIRGTRLAAEIDGMMLHAQDPTGIGEREIVEIFTPVIINGHFIGAIEFFSDITDLRSTLLQRLGFLIGGITTSGTGVAGIVLILMYRASAAEYRSLRKQSKLERSQSDKERDLLNEQLRLAREVRLLGELNEWLQSSRSLDELFEMVASYMTHILPETAGSVYVYSNSRDVLDGYKSWNGAEHRDHIQPCDCWGLRRGRVYEYGQGEVNFTCNHVSPHDGKPYYCFPVQAHGETVGLLTLKTTGNNVEQFRSQKRLAQMCAEQISLAIANVRMRDQLQDQTVRDPLTGLFNRRYLSDMMSKTLSESHRDHKSFCVIAVDVDHFKKFNDNHGHDAGDIVLRAVGTALENQCEREEVACRTGGEELMVLLPDCSLEAARAKAEALRHAVESLNVKYAGKTLPRITISLGVAGYPQHGTVAQDIMRLADAALYAAKAKGRNNVQVASLERSEEDRADSQFTELDSGRCSGNEVSSPENPDALEVAQSV